MVFANPNYLYLLLLLIPMIGWYVYKLSKSQASLQVSSSEAFEAPGAVSWIVYLRHVPFVLRMVAVALLIVILARPQSTNSWSNSSTEGIDIMLAMDISGSMLAQDLKPNRLEAAKDVAASFINGRPNDNIGLVVFSAESFTQCPLTTDHTVLLNLFKDIQSGMIQDGTAIGLGLANAVSRIKDSHAKSKVIILLTDGSNNAGEIAPVTAAEIAKTFGVRVYTIGVGTKGMAPYPFQTAFGVQYQNIPVEIDEATLKQIASTTGGQYFRATDNASLKEIYSEIDQMEKTKISVQEYSKKQEEYKNWALLVFALLLVEILLRNTLLAFYVYAMIVKKKAIKKYGNPTLLAELMPEVSTKRQHLKFWLLFGAITMVIFIIAGPQFGSKLETVKRQGVEIMVCLDVSNSMLAEDVSPNRLDKAKQMLSRLTDGFTNDKVGLIVFAGDAFTQLPITSDYISAKMFLSSINPSMVSTQGTAIGAAINLAARSFTPDETTDKAIILITDGENHEDDAIGAAKAAAEKGIHVNIVGMGDPKGSPIPIQGSNNYMKDKDGNVVITKLNEQMGQEIAAAGNGMYVRADNTNSALKALQKEIEKMNKTELDSKVYSEYDEQFQIFAWIALFLLIADFMTLDRKNRIFRKVKLFS